MKKTLGILCALLGSSAAYGAIISGTSSFDYIASSSLAIPYNVNLNVGGVDHAFQMWWYVRGPGDNLERFFPAVTSENEVGNVNTLTFADLGLASGPNPATLVNTLNATANGATLDSLVTLTNNGQSAAVYDLFFYFDLDMGGLSGSNSASGDASGINVSRGNWSALVTGSPTANAYQVAGFSGLRTLLADGSVTNLNGTGLPFSGDFTGALQFALTLQPGQSGNISTRVAIADANIAVESVPEPGTYMLFGAGLAAIAFLRRR